jgi:hypothetical protein
MNRTGMDPAFHDSRGESNWSLKGGAVRLRYVCPSATCRREREIEIPADNSRGFIPPTCTCGVTLKKIYSPPVFRKLTGTEAIQCFGDLVKLRETVKKAAAGL